MTDVLRQVENEKKVEGVSGQMENVFACIKLDNTRVH